MIFEFDETKRLENINKHAIDFLDIPAAFEQRLELGPTDRNGESRWIALMESGGVIIAVIYTMRGDNCRIISARKARDNERHAYHTLQNPPL